MPKEITHWLIAGNVVNYLDESSKLRRILNKYKSYYLLGTVIYDTPYSFLGMTKKQKQFKKIADKLHGAHGEDAFCPFKNIIKDIYSKNKDDSTEMTLAFSLGFLSHIIVDLNFHPMVYYLTGNYYSKNEQERNRAVSNHRWLETLLDLWFLKQASRKRENPIKYLSVVLKDVDNSKLSFLLQKFVQAIGIKDVPEAVKDYKTAVSYHAFFQKLFFVDWIRRLLVLFLGKDHKTVALFYPKSESFKGESSLVYLHPVTGFSHEITANDLRKNTENKLLTVFREIDRILYQDKSNEDLEAFINSLPDLSIETGVSKTSSMEMKFFNKDFNRSSYKQ